MGDVRPAQPDPGDEASLPLSGRYGTVPLQGGLVRALGVSAGGASSVRRPRLPAIKG
jgi:hypothetical protein